MDIYFIYGENILLTKPSIQNMSEIDAIIRTRVTFLRLGGIYSFKKL